MLLWGMLIMSPLISDSQAHCFVDGTWESSSPESREEGRGLQGLRRVSWDVSLLPEPRGPLQSAMGECEGSWELGRAGALTPPPPPPDPCPTPPQDWWNSTSFSNYYRTWNVVVHDWAVQLLHYMPGHGLSSHDRTLSSLGQPLSLSLHIPFFRPKGPLAFTFLIPINLKRVKESFL